VILLEVFSFLLLQFGSGHFAFLEEKDELPGPPIEELEKGEGKKASGSKRYVPHPYYGFTFEPGYTYTNYDNSESISANSRGFLGEEYPTTRDDAVFNVFITGGSVARNFFVFKHKEIEKRLLPLIGASAERVRVYSLAHAAWKQPQQVNAVSQLLVQGIPIDLLINIDGYNELAHTFVNHKVRGLAPEFPVFWKEQIRRRLSDSSKLLLGEIQLLKRLKQIIADFRSHSALAKSQTITLLSLVANEYVETRKIQAENKLQATNDSVSFAARGVIRSMSDKELANYSIDVWASSSEQLAKLSKHNFTYLHVLQPSQYYGGKVLTEEELKNAYAPEQIRSKAVGEHFPAMREHFTSFDLDSAQKLDASLLFAKDERTIFIDRCCHFNRTGHDALIDLIVDKLRSVNLAGDLQEVNP
jgi:hypothetical protein